jgi:hypothetical protein
MALLLTSTQCFTIAIVVFGVVGFIRGWRREVISLGFALGGVLFLLYNGGVFLADLIFVRLPILFQDLIGANPGAPKASSTPPSSVTVFATTLIAFIVIVAAGYYIGNKAVPAKASAATPFDRFVGIVPGLVTGFFLMTYITNVFAKSPIITFGVNTPSPTVVTNYVPLLFVVAIIAVVAGLVAARVKKSSSGGGGKK